MPGQEKGKKNSLSIRLTEGAVFLRTRDSASSRRRSNDQQQPSMLRGLLILDLAKPTRITSIELELTAKTMSGWPEGVGARRMEISEEHTIFSASTVYFRAGEVKARRAASIGPGTASFNDEALNDDWEEDQTHGTRTPRDHGEPARTHDLSTPDETNRSRRSRAVRRVSADYSFYQRSPISHHEDIPIIPTPPYSPFASTPGSPTFERPQLSPHHSHSSGTVSRVDEHAAHTLEALRNTLKADLRHHQRSHPSLSNLTNQWVLPERSLSRRPSIDDVPENELGPSIPRHHPPAQTPPEPSRSSSEHRGRKGARFSLASVSNALMDAVRPSSPKARGSASRDRQGGEKQQSSSRGRTMEKRNVTESPTGSISRMSKERSAFSKFGNILKLDSEEAKGTGEDWKEYKKGTYTYPISFAIPGNSPPTMYTPFGTVVWRLRATVHRPGAFKSKMIATRQVIMISCPTEDDTEDTENIIVERHWDQQLQYLISISGRSFYIGGTVPVTFALMPLAKIKIYRIGVFIEERVDYYTQMKRIARTDPIRRIELLSLKHEGKGARPILPLESDDVDAFMKSPLHNVLNKDDDPSEMASALMGPGPWTFQQEMKLPESCDMLRFTNKNKRSNIIVTHLLKCIMRVERGDDLHIDPKTGKRKMFDIVIQTPVQILSCRCNPEWTSLPLYTECFEDIATKGPSCPCEMRRLANPEEYLASLRNPTSALECMTSRLSSDSDASAVETTVVNPGTMPSLRQSDSMFERNTQYERLVSGQESELGEAPPAYID